MPSHTTSKAALLSVSDKTGIITFAKSLVSLGFNIVSTGGTFELLKKNGIPAVSVDSITRFPEILDGRVKTLHPNVHAGILADSSNPEHLKVLKQHQIEKFDIVCVNLYPFQDQVVGKNLSDREAIEWIDVGGPSMLRGSAKNYESCLPVCDPKDYEKVIELFSTNTLTIADRKSFAAKVFRHTADYDQAIFNFLSEDTAKQIKLIPHRNLRYGENPQQKAHYYLTDLKSDGSARETLTCLQGKELSYNNLIDLDAAIHIVQEFSSGFDTKQNACVIIKHTNPCGVAVGKSDTSTGDVFDLASSCDPKSAFGGIVGFNSEVDENCAQRLSKFFIECVVAPSYSEKALKAFQAKKNLRVVTFKSDNSTMKESQKSYRSIFGGILEQDYDSAEISDKTWVIPTQKKPSEQESIDLIVAMKVAKHVKSNAIVIAKNNRTIGIGAGQMSRVDAAKFALMKAKEFSHDLIGSVVASDAFLPFGDTVEILAEYKISSIIQPGGSIRDQESVDAADKNLISMVLSGTRHFKH